MEGRPSAGADVLSFRRTRRKEILLVLKKGGDVSAFEKALDQADGRLPGRKDACWRCRGASHVAKEPVGA